jgi:hypothetical protein
VRAEFLNKVLPAALTEFDRRLQGGEPHEIQPVNVMAMIERAVADVNG